jgi:hypothetical protein
MEAFNELRIKAREVRDRSIAQAREDYDVALRRITELEASLNREAKTTAKAIWKCIESVMPRDRSFEVPELIASLEALYPQRAWTSKIVNHRIGHLCKRGLVRRLKRSNGRDSAVYARMGVGDAEAVTDEPLMIDRLGAILRARGPMDITALTVALIEGGYRTKASGVVLRNNAGHLLRRYPDRFARQGEKWSLVK